MYLWVTVSYQGVAGCRSFTSHRRAVPLLASGTSQRRPAIFWCFAFGELAFSGSSFCAKENSFSPCECSSIFGGWGSGVQQVRTELRSAARPHRARRFRREPGGFEGIAGMASHLLFFCSFLFSGCFHWRRHSARLYVFVRNDEAHLRAEGSSLALRTKRAQRPLLGTYGCIGFKSGSEARALSIIQSFLLAVFCQERA